MEDCQKRHDSGAPIDIEEAATIFRNLQAQYAEVWGLARSQRRRVHTFFMPLQPKCLFFRTIRRWLWLFLCRCNSPT